MAELRDRRGPAARRRQEKRRYEAPRIVHSEPIEALAGTCDTSGGGKQPGQVSCNIFRS